MDVRNSFRYTHLPNHIKYFFIQSGTNVQQYMNINHVINSIKIILYYIKHNRNTTEFARLIL